MDLLADYGSSSSSSSDEDGGDHRVKRESSGTGGGGGGRGPPPPAPVVRRPIPGALDAAPRPSVLSSRGAIVSSGAPPPSANNNNSGLPRGGRSGGGGGGEMVLMNNPLKSQLHAPVQGPAHVDPRGPSSGTSRGKIGVMQANVAFDEVTFDDQRKAFQRMGRALGPDDVGTEVSVDPKLHLRRSNPAVAGGESGGTRKKKKRLITSAEERTVLVESENPYDDEANYGIWGPPSKAERELADDTTTDLAAGVELAPEQLAEREHLKEKARRRGLKEEGGDEAEKFDRLVERKMSHLLPPRMEGEEPEAIEPTTTFHGKEDEMVDYKGRSWISPPSGVRPVPWGDVDDHKCYVPKKCVARLTGHNKGVHRIRLFPGTGHLLLSGGLEGKCKVWNVSTKKCMRTYIGHSAAVRDVQFSSDGKKFLSCSFDRFVRLWNTESGEVLGTYTNRRVPYVVQFYPNDENTFVVGCSDNKIVAYDATTGEITQEYNHHLAPVNTITFCEDATKMVTSSDDKKVLVWEWDIGVPIKYISDPGMHSMPVITKHPSDAYWAGQSLDNQIVVYQARDRFALQRKKKFTGHVVAGYACDVSISPDGQFLCSGDGEGRVFFWEWKRQKLLQKYRAHDNGPAIGCAWHPIDPSVVFTCGWDGVIKMWQ